MCKPNLIGGSGLRILLTAIGICISLILGSSNSLLDKEFHVSLRYPAQWQKETGYIDRYKGENGFFALDAVAGGENMSIDEIVKFSTEHKLKPYGTNPKVSDLYVDGQEARMITASSDQPEEMNRQSELIVKYPEPVTIGGNTYYYFVMYTDKDHITDIAKTIRFIS